jgi:hypothetical protein
MTVETKPEIVRLYGHLPAFVPVDPPGNGVEKFLALCPNCRRVLTISAEGDAVQLKCAMACPPQVIAQAAT